MTYVNVLALFGGLAFLAACLRLYLTDFQARISTWFCAGILLAVSAPWIDHPGLGILRLFLVAGFLYHFCAWNRPGGSWLWHGVVGSAFLGVCAATRSEFGYLLVPWLLMMFSGSAVMRILSRTSLLWHPSFLSRPMRPVFRKGSLTAGAALLFSLALQFANHEVLTDGGTPGRDFYTLTYAEPQWLGDRAPVLDSLPGEGSLTDSEKAYWREGWRNLRVHPGKAMQNWRANINRMVFDFPFTRMHGKPAAEGVGNRALATSALFLLSVFCIYPWLRARKLIPGEVWLISVWTLVGLGLRSLLSAGSNAVLPWVPCLCVIICLTFGMALRIRARGPASAESEATGLR